MKTQRYTDDKLITEFNKGTAKALAAVYDKFYDHLYYFAYRLTRNKTEAEDITIVALGIVLRKHKDFETLERVKSYLYLTVKSKSLNYIDSQKQQRDLQKDLAETQNEALDEDTLAEMVRADFLNEIYRQVETLSPKKRNVFLLSYVDDLSNSEIAEKLHMSSDAVKFNKSKALEQLRIALFNKKPNLQAIGIIGAFSLLRFLTY